MTTTAGSWKRHIGVGFIVAYTVLVVAAWLPQGLAQSPVPVPVEAFAQKKLAEIVASVAMMLMGFCLILAARFRFLEDYFGGLDRMYSVHKVLGIISIWLLIAHFVLIPELTDEPNIGKPLGIVSLLGFTVLVLLTVIRKVPYHRWFPTHRFMGLFYILGIVHTMIADNMIVEGSFLSVLMRGLSFTAAGCYLYKEFWRERFGGKGAHAVEAMRPLKDAVELRLRPKGKKIEHRAGQFAFLRVCSGDAPGESHPFTISSGPGESCLRFTIKVLGDYTGQFGATLKPGDTVEIDGPFGRFNVHDAPSPQVWVAGGIGVTPFLSALRDNCLKGRQVDFFYAVRSRSGALLLDEINERIASHEDVRLHLVCSEEGERVTGELIAARIQGALAARQVFLCGPVPLVKAIRRQARASGVPRNAIHYEKFALR